jgi:peptidoglycan/xylan/chitin deacetylase (PgdA/CDA1 family)
MTATFFVVTDWVGTEGFISWDQLREMREWGMSIQSHSKSHPHLSELDGEALRFELEESRREIDAALGQRTTEIALPGGNAPKPHLRRVIGASGYEAVASSRWGANPDRSGQTPRRIHRCNVPRDIDAELAARIVKGDRALVIRHYPREAVLNGVRALLGADRYARWRRRFLNAVAGS